MLRKGEGVYHGLVRSIFFRDDLVDWKEPWFWFLMGLESNPISDCHSS